jgi:hypothetical protein
MKKDDRIDWHQGFISALRLEFQAYQDALEFYSEVNLNAKPLRIDAVIKMKRPVPIHKQIARIFRNVNILEYKSPEDYLSVDDMYKCLGYTYLYAALEHHPVTEMSLSVVVSRYPREALRHIRDVLGWGIAEQAGGIYRIAGGGPLAIQIIESGKLDEREDLWLKELRHNLRVENLDRIVEESKNYSEEYMGAYMDIILRANMEGLEELMSRKTTVREVLIRTGLAAEFEARGEAIGKAQGEAIGEARRMKQILEQLRSGKSVEELTRMYEEELNALPD